MGGELARELGRDLEQDGVVKEDQGGGVSDCGLVGRDDFRRRAGRLW